MKNKKELKKKITLLRVIKNVTVEPTLLLFIVSAMVTIMATQNLVLEKACRVDLNYDKDICDNLKQQEVDSQNVYESNVQKLAVGAIANKFVIMSVIPCFLSIFIGAWSDLTGRRRFFIVYVLFGHLMLVAFDLLNVYFFYELPMNVLVFGEAILEGVSGGWCVMTSSIFCYIGSLTSSKTRTFRLGIASYSMTVGLPIGIAVSGVILKNFGYYGAYGFSFAMSFINFLYVVIRIKDPPLNEEQEQQSKKGFLFLFKSFFDLTNILETFRIVFKNAPKGRRNRMFLLLGVVCLLFGPMYGEISIMYLSTRYRFNWDEVKFSIFQTYNFVTHTFGTIFSITVFSKYLQWHDSVLGIISTFSKIAASFIYCFAPNEKIFFIAPLVEILNGTALLAMRSICSKLVNPDELGKVNSILGLTENLMPLVYVPLYTKVYASTMEVLPGAVFLMGASMTFPTLLVFIYLLYEDRKQSKKTPKPEEVPLKEM